MDEELLQEIDNYRRQQPDLPNRAEAIRRLVRSALGSREEERS
jgi:metal-responsive CopG/Arc/MetJ family transcriptional regulator